MHTICARVAFLIGLLGAGGLGACPYSFREAGFIVRDRLPYRLLFILDEQSEATPRLQSWLESARLEFLEDSNVKAEIVLRKETRQPEFNLLLKGLELPANSAAVLVTPQKKALLLEQFHLANLTQDGFRHMFAQVVISPKREEMKSHLIRHWCVAVFVQGTDRTMNDLALTQVKMAMDQVVGEVTEMGRVIKSKPYLLEVDGTDSGEKVFLETLGLWRPREENPLLAAVFGQGRQFGPRLQGLDIDVDSVKSLFLTLGRSCACTSDPRKFLGPMLPIQWPLDLQKQVKNSLGYDPNSPQVAMSLSSVWTVTDHLDLPRKEDLKPVEDYVEIAVKQSTEPGLQEGDDLASVVPVRGSGTERQSPKEVLVRKAEEVSELAAESALKKQPEPARARPEAPPAQVKKKDTSFERSTRKAILYGLVGLAFSVLFLSACYLMLKHPPT